MYFYVGRRRMLRPQLFCCPLPFSGAGLQIGSSFFCPEGAKKVWRSDEVEVSGDDFFLKKREKCICNPNLSCRKAAFLHTNANKKNITYVNVLSSFHISKHEMFKKANIS